MLLSLSCSSDDSTNQSDNSLEIQNIKNTVTSGSWSLTYFFDTDKEETSNFSGYSFTFNSDGKLIAINSSVTIEGDWSVTDSNSNDDSSDDIDFNITFSAPSNFQELSDDWDIILYSSNKIELIDISGGNGGTDYLTFEKL
ncbi:hypothetical protein GCM10022257_18770 [Hyunsoonleella aestuarii]|uniref:Lipocalin-like domain-containing protein n=2 Tax=Hyunsoonleella aestuarii TaxID=912802 RepID=A0ABP8EC32_9FLAO